MLSCEASVAQLVEQLICNQWAGGSSPFAGSKFYFRPATPKGRWPSKTIVETTTHNPIIKARFG